MHLPTYARRLTAAGILSLGLSTTAAAELTKLQCYEARMTLAGVVAWNVASCFARREDCVLQAQADTATWSDALEKLGCAPWPTEEGTVLRALEYLPGPPPDFWNDCGVEAGVCGGTCAEPLHVCQDDRGECRCVFTGGD